MTEPAIGYDCKCTLKCNRCGQYIYYDDDYRGDGYGGHLCADCIKEMDYKEEDMEDE